VQEIWSQSPIQSFWSEIAATDHLIQLYENESAFLNSLEGFTGSGFLAKDSVIVIATDSHLTQLNTRLIKQGFDVNRLIARNLYLPLDAEETLQNFMVNGKPDEKKFTHLINGIVSRVRRPGNRVRAFGEMVALLWNNNNREATRELEDLWNKFCAKEKFCLFCAYPKTGLVNASMHQICCSHTKIISGAPGPTSQVFYREVVPEKNHLVHTY
jgi:hypothetical protein